MITELGPREPLKTFRDHEDGDRLAGRDHEDGDRLADP
jgi:hypothetical protein